MKFLLTSLAATSLAIAQPAFATPQDPDKLILEGEQLSLETNPLSPLIEAERITLPAPAKVWSSNWRGYVATWEVKDGQLLLNTIEVLLRPAGAAEKAPAVPTDVLPNVFSNQTRVPADWFSGTLVIPRGKVVEYVHMGYSSTHERYTILRVEKGSVVSRSDLSAKEFQSFRKERFAAYQKTAEYAARFNEACKELSASAAEQFLYQFAVEDYMSAAP